ncbi:MAG: hypothetical protein M3Y33_06105 [Actinomycetota bacterium]|nr:hypothetical protein [Actinomycetota bacterium]
MRDLHLPARNIRPAWPAVPRCPAARPAAAVAPDPAPPAEHPAGLCRDILSGPAGLAAFLRTGLLASDFPGHCAFPG